MGIGPGNGAYLCGRAVAALNEAEVIAGYTTYIDLIRDIIGDKPVIETGMKKEVDRVSAAIDEALEGRPCAIVSSGDPGIYAMAGLVFEMCRERGIDLTTQPQPAPETGTPRLTVEVVPGIPALAAGAALLGAPLTHDFAAVSLSDLLTPWEVIEKRLDAAAAADFVLVIYNPKSKRRDTHLERARDIILNHRDAATPVGVVTGAMRENQRVVLTTLGELHRAEVDMQTTVFVGNAASFVFSDHLVTPRGYSGKYRLDGSEA